MWGRVAQATGGMLLEPSRRTSGLLADGMLSIVQALLSRLLPGQPDSEVNSLPGFTLLDVSGLLPAETEDVSGRGHARHTIFGGTLSLEIDYCITPCVQGDHPG